MTQTGYEQLKITQISIITKNLSNWLKMSQMTKNYFTWKYMTQQVLTLSQDQTNWKNDSEWLKINQDDYKLFRLLKCHRVTQVELNDSH